MACTSNPADSHQVHLRQLVRSGRKAEPICPTSIPLDFSKPVVFGRILSPEVNVRLLSKCYPLMISRKHATVAFNGGKWTITDHGTLNGVYVNESKITANIPHPVLNGDKLTFGCAVGAEQPEFEYIFENVSAFGKVNRTSNQIDGALKLRKINSNILNGSIQGTSRSGSRALLNGYDTRIKAEEQRLEFLSSELAMKTAQCVALQRRMEDKEKYLVAQLEEQKLNLEVEKAMAEGSLEHLLNEKLKEKEQLLKNQYNEQISLLEAERQAVENHLQTELNRKLSEQDKIHQEELEQQKGILESMLLTKESEKSNLEMELNAKQGIAERLKSAEEIGKNLELTLNELREKIRLKESELHQQQGILEELAKKSVVDTMEDEFTCIICQELFIHASTLACAHTFCKTCINSWLSKKRDCPVCRCRVQSKPVRSVVLDNAVARVVDCFDQESKSRRDLIYRERLTEEEKQETDPRISPIHLNGQNGDSSGHTNEQQENDVQIVYDSNRNPEQASNSSHRTQFNRRAHHPYNNNESRNRHRRGRQNEHSQHDSSRRAYQQDRSHNNQRREGNYNWNNNNSFSQPLFDTNVGNQFVGHCFMCGMRGHYSRDCPFRR